MPNDSRRSFARGWTAGVGLLALIGSGVFSVLLVLARTPVVNTWLPGTDFFRVALVVHVDLSVSVWFVALAGMLWSLNSAPAGGRSGLVRALRLRSGALRWPCRPFSAPALRS